MVTNQVGGWPPLSVTFQTEEDRQEVLARAASLVTDRASNIQVTQCSGPGATSLGFN